MVLMAKYIKNWRLIINGTKGYDYAQITKGGVKRDELDDRYVIKGHKDPGLLVPFLDAMQIDLESRE